MTKNKVEINDCGVWATDKQNWFIKKLILQNTNLTNNELQAKHLKVGEFEFIFSAKHKSGIYYGVPKAVASDLINALKTEKVEVLD